MHVLAFYQGFLYFYQAMYANNHEMAKDDQKTG